jgi:cardiolipin synthase
MPDREKAGAAVFRDAAPFDLAVGAHRLTIYASGGDRRRALFDLIENARHSLDVCFYIFATDATGTAVRDALTRAAQRGVAVTLMLDRFGADADQTFFTAMCQAGGVFHCFSPKLTQRYLIRNHQKMVIADGTRALFGGFNIADDYFAPPEGNGWNDMAIAIEGAAVTGLAQWFARLLHWTQDPRPKFLRLRRAVRTWEWSDGQLRWLVGGPSKGLSSWARCVSKDLIRAQRLDMIMAYFAPSQRLLRKVGRIAARGRARLVVAAKSDNNATIGATRSLYDYLLRQSAQVWEFQPCKLHTKLIIVDDAVYLGSANFDVRSLYLNVELMLRIEDRAVAERMRDYVSGHIAASERITPALHKQRASLWNRVRWNLGWLLVSVVDYTVTRKLNLGL